MELKGKLIDIVRDIRTGAFRLTLEVMVIPSGIERFLEGTTLAISLKKWREKRSLTANAYYWVLISKIADAINQPKPVIHNLMLRRYGTLEVVDGQHLMIFIPDTEEAEKTVLNAELYHLKPTSKVKEGKNGTYRAHLMIKGSSEYDTKEMSALIDGVVYEARQMGIETLPEEDLERMMMAYEEHRAD